MKNSIPVLLVEDSKIDIKNVERAFSKNKITNPLFVTRNGEEALAYLRREPPYDNPIDAPRPGIILLDINMPVMNGIEFLQTIKKSENFRDIPVVVLTTSQEERDRMESFLLGVAGYIIKPVDFPKFVEAIRVINLYWCLSELP